MGRGRHGRRRRGIVGAGAPRCHVARHRLPGDVLLPPTVRRRSACGRDGGGPERRRRRPHRRCRDEPGRCARSRGCGARTGVDPAVPRRYPVPLRHRTRHGHRARSAVHGARSIPRRPPGARGDGAPHAQLRRQRRPRIRIRAKTLVSVGLRDPITPPSTVFAAYNAIDAPKEIAVFPYGEHEVPTVHAERQLAEFARELG